MDITKSSPYAAPNTPIASSKRPRISSKVSSPGLKSPSSTHHSSRLHTTTTPDRHSVASEAKEYSHKPHHKNSNGTAVNTNGHSNGHNNTNNNGSTVPCTPSKNLFSPGLRPDQHKKSNHDENVELNNVSSVSYSSDEDDTAPAVSIPVNIHHSKTDDNVEEEEEEVFNPYSFIAGLPGHHLVKVKGKMCLPPAAHRGDKITLVLDLDETLVHCTVEPIEKPDLVFPVAFNGNVYQVYVRKRPYLDYFLETVAKTFEVVVFTASQKVYADVLLDQIDPHNKFIDHRLFREACLLVQGNYLKDLEVLGRNANKTVLVDNSPHAYGYQIDQGIPIESWYDDDNDTELLKLIGFLRRLTDVEDVKPIVRDQFKTHQLIANAKAGLPPMLTAPPF
jgi:CTD small phosphatase-like protein 2